MGGLHLEMASLKALGKWLSDSGWIDALVQAEVTMQGRAEAMLTASHVARTQYAHQVGKNGFFLNFLMKVFKRHTIILQVTAVVLHSLQQKAYECYNLPMKIWMTNSVLRSGIVNGAAQVHNSNSRM